MSQRPSEGGERMDWAAAAEMVCSLEFWRMAVLWPLALLSSYFHLLLARPLSAVFPSLRPPPPCPRRPFSPDPDHKIERPICIVTGATSGLGKAAAAALASEGYHVILAGRSPQLLSEAVKEIELQHQDVRVNAFQLDLSSFRSILQFESSIKQWLLESNLHPSVQLLINNAGILAKSCRVTDDGYDQMMETNYIGAFILTSLLLQLLKNSPVPSRIVNVTSFTHHCVSDAQLVIKNLRCLSISRKYPLAHIYECSKLCLLLFAYELHRQLYIMDPSPTISVNSADPGFVETSIMRELPKCLSQMAFMVLRCCCLLQSPKNGVCSIIDAALAPPEVSGKYFFGGKGRTIKSSSLSCDAKLAEELWCSSNVLLKGYLQVAS